MSCFGGEIVLVFWPFFLRGLGNWVFSFYWHVCGGGGGGGGWGGGVTVAAGDAKIGFFVCANGQTQISPSFTFRREKILRLQKGLTYRKCNGGCRVVTGKAQSTGWTERLFHDPRASSRGVLNFF